MSILWEDRPLSPAAAGCLLLMWTEPTDRALAGWSVFSAEHHHGSEKDEISGLVQKLRMEAAEVESNERMQVGRGSGTGADTADRPGTVYHVDQARNPELTDACQVLTVRTFHWRGKGQAHMPERCNHPQDQRSPSETDPDRIYCARCERDFLPRGATTRHGTYRGYARHSKAKKGQWGWPIGGDCGCAQAGRDYRTAHDKKPHVKESNLRRGKARLAALHRLRRIHPSEYNAMYVEELEKAGGNPRPVPPPVWDDIIARLVKAALDKDEASAVNRIRARMADRRETEVMRYITRLRLVMDNFMRREEGES